MVVCWCWWFVVLGGSVLFNCDVFVLLLPFRLLLRMKVINQICITFSSNNYLKAETFYTRTHTTAFCVKLSSNARERP